MTGPRPPHQFTSGSTALCSRVGRGGGMTWYVVVGDVSCGCGVSLFLPLSAPPCFVGGEGRGGEDISKTRTMKYRTDFVPAAIYHTTPHNGMLSWNNMLILLLSSRHLANYLDVKLDRRTLLLASGHAFYSGRKRWNLLTFILLRSLKYIGITMKGKYHPSNNHTPAHIHYISLQSKGSVNRR